MNNDNREIYREQFLRHYGILGMKWGARKRSVTTSVKSKKSSSNQSSQSGTKRRMSNKELTSKLKRIKLEQEYEKLTAVPKPQTVSKVEKLVKSAGTVAALSGSALTIYKNLNELSKAASKVKP